MNILALLITLAIYGLIFYILYWGVSKVSLPEPFNKVAQVILVIAVVVVLIGILTGQIHAFPFFDGNVRLK